MSLRLLLGLLLTAELLELLEKLCWKLTLSFFTKTKLILRNFSKMYYRSWCRCFQNFEKKIKPYVRKGTGKIFWKRFLKSSKHTNVFTFFSGKFTFTNFSDWRTKNVGILKIFYLSLLNRKTLLKSNFCGFLTQRGS